MNADQMRIKIAKFCGYSEVHESGSMNGVVGKRMLLEGQAHYCWENIPNYPSDLNAIAEAESKLDAEKNILPEDVGEETQQQAYYCELERVVSRGCAEDDIYWHTVHATAAQRAEALCMVIDAQESTNPKTL
jgi:hypothetical protein